MSNSPNDAFDRLKNRPRATVPARNKSLTDFNDNSNTEVSHSVKTDFSQDSIVEVSQDSMTESVLTPASQEG